MKFFLKTNKFYMVVIALLAVVLCAVLLVGCGRGDNPDKEPEVETNKLITLDIEFRDIFDQPLLTDCEGITISAGDIVKSFADRGASPITSGDKSTYFYHFTAQIESKSQIEDLKNDLSVTGISDGLVASKMSSVTETEGEIKVVYVVGAKIAAPKDIHGTIYVHSSATESNVLNSPAEIIINGGGTPIYSDNNGKFIIPKVYGDLSLSFSATGYLFENLFVDIQSAAGDLHGVVEVEIYDDASDLQSSIKYIKSFAFFNDASNYNKIGEYYVTELNQIRLQQGEIFDLAWCIRYFTKDKSTIMFQSSNPSVFEINNGVIETEDKDTGEAELTIVDTARPETNTLTINVKIVAKTLRVKEVLVYNSGNDGTNDDNDAHWTLLKDYTLKLGQTYDYKQFKVEAGYYLNGYFVEDTSIRIGDFLCSTVGIANEFIGAIDNDYNHGFKSLKIIGVVSFDTGANFTLKAKGSEITTVDIFTFKTDFTENSVKGVIRAISGYSVGNITSAKLSQIGSGSNMINGKTFSGSLNSLNDLWQMPNIDTLNFSGASLPSNAIFREELVELIKNCNQLKRLNVRDGDSLENSKLKDLINGTNYNSLKPILNYLQQFTINYMSTSAWAINEFIVGENMSVLDLAGAKVNVLNLLNMKYIVSINLANSGISELVLPDGEIFTLLNFANVNLLGTTIHDDQIRSLQEMCGG